MFLLLCRQMIRPDLNDAVVAQGVAGTTTVVAAVAGKSICVEQCALVLGAAGTAKFQSAAVDITGAFSLAANGGLVLPAAVGRGRWFKTAPGAALNLVTTGGAANGVLSYHLEDV